MLREKTLSDTWYDIRARVVLPDGTSLYSAHVRALARNKAPEFVGIAPVWNPKKSWAASFVDYRAFVHSYDKAQAQGVYESAGNTMGKELGATTVVADPDSLNAYGHRSFGNVVFADVSNNYAAQTAAMAVRDTWSQQTYPSYGDQAKSGSLRWQFTTPPRFVEGDLSCYGYSFRLDPEFGTPINSHISLGQDYGSANAGNFDWSLGYMLDAHQKISEHRDTAADTFQVWGNRLNPFERAMLFSMPFHRGKWVDLVRVVGWSKDARLGFMEFYTAQPGVNNGSLTQWVFPNGATRLQLVTLPELADGTPHHTHIYRSYSAEASANGVAISPPNQRPWPSPNRIRAHFYGMKVGPTVESVNPGAYNTRVVYR